MTLDEYSKVELGYEDSQQLILYVLRINCLTASIDWNAEPSILYRNFCKICC
ncbi:hypothetical protein CBL_10175 [Carabus blaptoides fortunei]